MVARSFGRFELRECKRGDRLRFALLHRDADQRQREKWETA